eukprot:m.110601 g.110601  ORF g.110601 m.110601 type:complete len:237 (-) comp16983_c0_seq1:195-905(-)
MNDSGSTSTGETQEEPAKTTLASRPPPSKTRTPTTGPHERFFNPLSDSDEDADVNQHHCSALYPGCQFKGYQTNGDKKYEVEVRLREVNLAQSYLCGDLLIRGLTTEYPELITCFDAEVIGDRYNFETGKWKTTRSIDLQHWRRFGAFAGVEQQDYKHDPKRSDHMFMRWKEQFLVPDHRVDALKGGASFAGFYYICFQRDTGHIDGLYYHTQSEMYQRLVLKRVPERKFGTYDFR